VPVRQWVLSLPYHLHYLLAWDHGLAHARGRLRRPAGSDAGAAERLRTRDRQLAGPSALRGTGRGPI